MSPVHILYAASDVEECRLFSNILSELNFKDRVSIVNDGNQLMQNIAVADFSIPTFIFLDIKMPGKNGIECLEAIRSNPLYNSVPVIMLTTSINTKRIHKCFEKRASRYIVKPPTLSRLRFYIAIIFQMDVFDLLNPKQSNFVLH